VDLKGLRLASVGGCPAIMPDIGRDRNPKNRGDIVNAWLDGEIGSDELLEEIEFERGLRR